MLQEPLPVVGLKVLCEHALHGPALGPLNPTLHSQSAIQGEPVEVVVDPLGHAVQSPLPQKSLNVPTAHSEQGCPSKPANPEYPLKQRQAEKSTCAVRICPEFSGQDVHDVEPFMLL
jgi:hypothetical protein